MGRGSNAKTSRRSKTQCWRLKTWWLRYRFTSKASTLVMFWLAMNSVRLMLDSFFSYRRFFLCQRFSVWNVKIWLCKLIKKKEEIDALFLKSHATRLYTPLYLSVRPSIRLSITFYFFGASVFGLTAVAQMLDWNQYDPCPPERDSGSRASGLVQCTTSLNQSSRYLVDSLFQNRHSCRKNNIANWLHHIGNIGMEIRSNILFH